MQLLLLRFEEQACIKLHFEPCTILRCTELPGRYGQAVESKTEKRGKGKNEIAIMITDRLV